MRDIIAAILVLACVCVARAEEGETTTPSAEEIVQSQVEAYNRHDLEAFLATYAEDVALYTHPGKLDLSGIGAMRESYGELFETYPELRVEITTRIVQGRFVIDQEIVEGIPGAGDITAVAIYEVRDGKIQNVWFIE